MVKLLAIAITVVSGSAVVIYLLSEIFSGSKGDMINFWAPLISAVIGAAVTSAVTLVVFGLAEQKSRLESELREQERRRNVALRLNMGFQAMFSGAVALQTHISDCFKEAAPHNLSEAWQAVLPVVTFDAPKRYFSLDELALILLSDDLGLVNHLKAFERATIINLRAAEKYSSLREDFSKKLPVAMSDGMLGISKLPSEQKMWLEKDEAVMNRLLHQIIEDVDASVEEMKGLVSRLQKAIRFVVKDDNLPQLEVV